MKKLIYICVLTAVLALFRGCAPKQEAFQPDSINIQKVCELATAECYYNQLAKDIKPRAPGYFIFKEVDREYWIEYRARATIGVDASKIKFDVQGTDITVTIPPAQILGELYLDKDSYDENSIVVSNDSFFNKNPVTAEDCDKTVNQSLEQLREKIEKDADLMASAQSDVKDLLENYIQQVSASTGVEYSVTWNLLTAEQADSAPSETPQNSALSRDI